MKVQSRTIPAVLLLTQTDLKNNLVEGKHHHNVRRQTTQRRTKSSSSSLSWDFEFSEDIVDYEFSYPSSKSGKKSGKSGKKSSSSKSSVENVLSSLSWDFEFSEDLVDYEMSYPSYSSSKKSGKKSYSYSSSKKSGYETYPPTFARSSEDVDVNLNAVQPQTNEFQPGPQVLEIADLDAQDSFQDPEPFTLEVTSVLDVLEEEEEEEVSTLSPTFKPSEFKTSSQPTVDASDTPATSVPTMSSTADSTDQSTSTPSPSPSIKFQKPPISTLTWSWTGQLTTIEPSSSPTEMVSTVPTVIRTKMMVSDQPSLLPSDAPSIAKLLPNTDTEPLDQDDANSGFNGLLESDAPSDTPTTQSPSVEPTFTTTAYESEAETQILVEVRVPEFSVLYIVNGENAASQMSRQDADDVLRMTSAYLSRYLKQALKEEEEEIVLKGFFVDLVSLSPNEDQALVAYQAEASFDMQSYTIPSEEVLLRYVYTALSSGGYVGMLQAMTSTNIFSGTIETYLTDEFLEEEGRGDSGSGFSWSHPFVIAASATALAVVLAVSGFIIVRKRRKSTIQKQEESSLVESIRQEKEIIKLYALEEEKEDEGTGDFSQSSHHGQEDYVDDDHSSSGSWSLPQPSFEKHWDVD